jgi:serine/threonine protein kinase
MDCGTITDIMRRSSNKIPENILGCLSVQIIKGLAKLHQKRIVHRDIKPTNILLNSRGYAKISDFGVSGVILQTDEGRNTLIGTYLYMSPERIKANNHSFVSDIWSVGMTILECALGVYPYYYKKEKRITDVWMLQQTIVSNPPKWPQEEEFSEEFVDFINSCLEKDPEKRPNCAQLLNHPFILLYEQNAVSELKDWIKSLD